MAPLEMKGDNGKGRACYKQGATGSEHWPLTRVCKVRSHLSFRGLLAGSLCAGHGREESPQHVLALLTP